MGSENSSIGDVVSARGEVVSDENEDENLYYIPERRRSLDLGETPMDTSNWYEEMFNFPLRVLPLPTSYFCET